MKKTLALMLAAMLLVTGCGQSTGKTPAGTDNKEQAATETQTAETAQEPAEATEEETAAEPATEETATAGETETAGAAETTAETETASEAETSGEANAAQTAEGGSMGMENPWTEVETIEEAAAGAGLDGFDLVENLDLRPGEMVERSYRYMDGVAEVTLEFAAVMVNVRKGKAPEDGDISGDYNTYTYNWTQNIKGLNVNCYGNREAAAAKTIWTLGDYSYSITAIGLGGDDAFGLNADDINSIVNGLQ